MKIVETETAEIEECLYVYKKNTNNNMCALFFNGIIVNLYFWSWEKIDALNGRLDLEWVQELLLQFGPSIFFSYHLKIPGFLDPGIVCVSSHSFCSYIYIVQGSLKVSGIFVSFCCYNYRQSMNIEKKAKKN